MPPSSEAWTVWHGVVNAKHTNEMSEWTYAEQDIVLKKGEEMGRLLFGSTIVMLFRKEAIGFNQDRAPERKCAWAKSWAITQHKHSVHASRDVAASAAFGHAVQRSGLALTPLSSSVWHVGRSACLNEEPLMTSCTELIPLGAVPARPMWSLPRAGMVTVPFGGNHDRDACGFLARPSGPNAYGDGILSLRAAPASRYGKLLRLTAWNELFPCTSKGEWAILVEMGSVPFPISD